MARKRERRTPKKAVKISGPKRVLEPAEAPRASRRVIEHSVGNVSSSDWAWNYAKMVEGKNPNLYRRDPKGDEIYRPSFGTNTQHGWIVEFDRPTKDSRKRKPFAVHIRNATRKSRDT